MQSSLYQALLAGALFAAGAPALHAEANAPAESAALFITGCRDLLSGDIQGAEKSLRQAAEQDAHPLAGLTYGVYCFTEHLYAPASLYLTAAAASGNADALFCLGYMHYKGWGVVRNAEQAIEFFTAASRQGHAQARTMLGFMLLTGDGAEPDAEAAAVLLNEALHAEPADGNEEEDDDNAPQDDADDTPDGDTTSDDNEDEEMCRQMVENLLEHNELLRPTPRLLQGYMHLRGVGVPEHRENALSLLINAANSGDSDDTTEHTIATLFRRGIGIAANEARAAEWDERVAEDDRARIAPLLDAYLSAPSPEEARRALTALLLPPRDENAEKHALIELIMKVPPYSVHEANRTGFRLMLDEGAFRREDGRSYLSIPGDGTRGARVFALTDKGELYILEDGWKDGTFDFSRFDAATGELIHLFDLKYEELSNLMGL